MKKYNETWQEVSKKWDAGDNVWSAELGGIGPGYEQAIQCLLFKILSMAPKDIKFDVDQNTTDYTKQYSELVDHAVEKLNNFGFSGAQVGTAKCTAFQFIHYGYSKMMNKLPDDRHIQVSNDFPVYKDL